MTEPLEIERKFLIEMPERAVLDRCPTRWEIWQTYLLAPPGISARVRRRVGETEQFFHTEKLRRTDRTCVEREREITRAEYEMLLRQQDPDRVYGFLFAGQEVRFTVDGDRLQVVDIK